MDDQESLRDTLGELLTKIGFEVTRARNGHDAVSYHQEFQERGKPFALDLLDLTVPGGMGGAETARRLRAAGSNAILVAMSGYSEEGEKVKLEESGFCGILIKPFSQRELTSLLERLFLEDVG